MKARENPFRRDCIERLAYRAPDFAWEKLEEKLIQLGGRGAIVGPKGHGKTTLLEQWAQRHPGSIHVRLSEGQRFLSPVQRETIRTRKCDWIFVDSAEQLNWLGWRELQCRVSRDCRLIIAVHRPGRLPTLFRCTTSPGLLGELISELTDHSFDPQSLWQRHRGNLREALRELYDAPLNPFPKSTQSA